VSAVDNRIDPTSRTLQVEAQIANDDGKLRPGMSFSVSMTFPGETFPSVDPLSVQWSSKGAYLWRYVDKKVEKVPVQIIQRNSDGILVKADLKEGDQVVTQGVQQLTAGATVRLLDEVADAGEGGKGGAGGKGAGQGTGGDRAGSAL
jgi:RND family efflux transporter MFP subunit